MRRPHFVILILSALGLPSISPAFADGALAAPATPPGLREVLAQVKPDEMWRVVELFATIERTSSSPGERRAASYLNDALQRLGVPHQLREVRSFLSVPISAALAVLAPEPLAFKCITPSFSASTGAGGLEKPLVYVGPRESEVIFTRTEDFTRTDCRGRIALLRGYPGPELIELAERAGAAGAVCIAPSPRLVNMIVSTVWGHPTPEEAARLPRIPIVTVSEIDGTRLETLCGKGPVSVRLEAKTDTGWKSVPLLVAEIKGSIEPERFVLIGNHLDAWHEGVTDNATGNGAMLEIARVLQASRSALRRSVRIAWWPGHSTGRYSGSTWYADTFYRDLRDNAVAYVATDSPGVRNATDIEPEGMFEAKEFLEGALRQQGVTLREATHTFRYNDESLWGIGVPSLTFYPAIPQGHPDRAKDAGGSAYGFWWHTKDDSLDKADVNLLVRDTRLYLALLWPLATREILPFDFTATARQMRETIETLSASAKGRWDFFATLKRIAAFEEAAKTLQARAAAASGEQAAGRVNAAEMAISRALDPVLYTYRGPYYQDPAVQFPLFPGLREAARLASLDPESNEAGFVMTALLRESNRIDEALDRATDLARPERP